MLLPPSPFSDPNLERDFLNYHATQLASARRAALSLGLLLWLLAFAWDVPHLSITPAFDTSYNIIVSLRLIGAFLFLGTLWWLRGRNVYQEMSVTTAIALLGYLICLTILGMFYVAPPPYDYLSFYPSLLLLVVLLSGVAHLRARPLGWLLTAILLSSTLVFYLNDEPSALVPHVELAMPHGHVSAAIPLLSAFLILGYWSASTFEHQARVSYSQAHRINEKAQTQSRFLAEAAHDLRQPIQAVGDFLEASRLYFDKKEYEHARLLCQDASYAAQVMRSSLNAVLDLSRLEAGFVAPNYSVFDVQALVDDVATKSLRFAQDRNVAIRCATHRAVPAVYIYSDLDLLRRVVDNLITNAVKYADLSKPAGAAVLIGIVCLPDCVRLDVVDNGLGIPEHEMDKVFQPFYQLHTGGTSPKDGIGLGLSIVKSIVDLMENHRLMARSRTARGSRFSLALPSAFPSDAVVVNSSSNAVLPNDVLDGLYILVVTNESLLQRSVYALLQGHGALCELAASYGSLDELVTKLERDPDIIVTDYWLPDGFTATDVIEKVRSAFDTHIPAIIVTGETSQITLPSTLDDVPVLHKPIAPMDLIFAISALPRREAGSVAA